MASTVLRRGVNLKIFREPEAEFIRTEPENTPEQWEEMLAGYEAGLAGLDEIRQFVSAVVKPPVARTAILNLVDQLENMLEELDDYRDEQRRVFMEG
jgi:hypothetical protein